jgi:hypothetical protein
MGYGSTGADGTVAGDTTNGNVRGRENERKPVSGVRGLPERGRPAESCRVFNPYAVIDGVESG